jgi:TrkA domain protein
MANEIIEHDMPGIGRSYEMETIDGNRVVIVLHHSGRRDIYVDSPERSPDEPALVSLTDDQARRIGSIIAGTFFKPAVVAEVESLIGGLLIEWLTVRTASPGANRSIADLAIRHRTRMTVAALVRADGSQVIAPLPEEVLRPGDQVIVIGRPQDLPALTELVIG